MTNLRFIAFVLAAAALPAQDTPPAPLPKPAGQVQGKVINSTNGEALRKVSITLFSQSGPKGMSYGTVSDSNGTFRIADVDPGEYTIGADHQGFMVKGPGASGAPLPPVKVEKGQPVPEITVPMIPLGVITGRVTDDDGDLVRGAMVRTMQYGYNGGKRILRNVNGVVTNDKGEYRLYGLRPGTFYLQATARANQVGSMQAGDTIRGPKPSGHALTYYPSTTDAAHAVPLEVTPGTLLRGIDIRLRRDALYVVRGKFPPEENQQTNFGGNYMMQLVSREGNRNGVFSSRRTNDIFEFPAVQPGSYVVLGVRVEGEKRLYAFQPVEVGAQDVEVGTLGFSPGADLAGAVQIEGPKKQDVASVRIGLQAETPSMFGFPNSEVKPDGTFVMHDVAPAIYRVSAQFQGTYLKTVKLGEQESPDGRVDLTRGSGPLYVVLASDVAQVEGSVKKRDGEPAARVRVTLVPEGDRIGREEFSRFAFTSEKGDYTVRNIPPGDYKVFAWEDVPQGAPQDPEFRKPFEKRGIALKIEPNGKSKADLTVISVAEMQHPDQ